MGKRRGHGEGTIYRRQDGRWVAAITLPDGSRKSHYAKTQKEALRWLNEATHDRNRGLPIAQDERQTFGDYLTGWLPRMRPHVRPRTYIRAEQLLRNHLTPALRRTTLARLSAGQLETLYAAKLAEELAPTTVARLHAVIRRALGDAERLGLVPRNVAKLAKAPSGRAVRREMRPLSPDEARTLLDMARGDRLEALYVLALSTGMRRGELLALHWADLELDAGRVQVRYTLQEPRGGGFDFAAPKTAKSRRQIELSGAAIASLRRHRARQAQERLTAGAAWQDGDLVFTNTIGHPIHGTDLLRHAFKPLLLRAGLPRSVRFHDLRHTAATLLLRQGVHPKIVQEMLGHASITMTLDTYSHVLPGMQQSAAAAMDGLLGGSVQNRVQS